MVEEEVPDNLAATVSKRRRELIGTCTYYIVHVYVQCIYTGTIYM